MLVVKVIGHVHRGVYGVAPLSNVDDTEINEMNLYTIQKYEVKKIENETKCHTQYLESSEKSSSTEGADPRSGFTSEDVIGSTDSNGKEEDTSSLEEESDGEKEASKFIERKEKNVSKLQQKQRSNAGTATKKITHPMGLYNIGHHFNFIHPFKNNILYNSISAIEKETITVKKILFRNMPDGERSMYVRLTSNKF
eukprot:13473888-Ditylum_brightwellii.AAC.1